MSASAPSNLPKRFAAARLEDQEDIETMAREPIRMGTPPFSSPDPETDGIRMLPLTQGHGSVSGTDGGDNEDYGNEPNGTSSEDDSDKKAADWKAEIEDATSQEELDAVSTRYSESNAEYSTVDSAIEKKQEELNSSDEDDDSDSDSDDN